MKNAIDFLCELQANNNKAWFDANRDRYKRVQAEFNDFTAALIDGIASFDDSVRGLTPKDCTYRIYRDVRFSANKLPYKSHMGAYVCPGGKKSGNAGYYFHVEPPCEGGMMGGYFITSGLYMPEPVVLKSVREDICYNGEEFLAALHAAEGFVLGKENALKRAPAGFPTDSPYAEYLKLRDIYVEKQLTEKEMLSPNLLSNIVSAFARTYDLSRYLNRAVRYAREEMS